MTTLKAILFSLMIITAGCSQGAGAISYNIQHDSKFNVIFLEDIRQAKILAERADDTIALKCWTYLEEFAVANAPGLESPAGEVVGVFSTYQKARNVRRAIVEVKISDQFRLECGPMLTDTMGTLGRIGIRLRVVAL